MISYDIIWYSIISWYHILYHISYDIIYHITSYDISYDIPYDISYHIIYHISYHTISYHIISYISYHISYHMYPILSYPISFIIKLIKTVPQTENTSSIDHSIFIYRISSYKGGMRWREIYDGARLRPILIFPLRCQWIIGIVFVRTYSKRIDPWDCNIRPPSNI